MSELGDKIAKEAFTWLNTPFVHQGQIKGRAVDCAHFIEGVIKNALPVSDDGSEMLKAVAKYADVSIPRNYPRHSDGVEMLEVLNRYLTQVPSKERQSGDVLALCDENCREPDIPRHLIIVHEVSEKTTYVINATAQGVKRHRLDQRWERRIHSVWRAHA